jgi:hypothetical protein
MRIPRVSGNIEFLMMMTMSFTEEVHLENWRSRLLLAGKLASKHVFTYHFHTLDSDDVPCDCL